MDEKKADAWFKALAEKALERVESEILRIKLRGPVAAALRAAHAAGVAEMEAMLSTVVEDLGGQLYLPSDYAATARPLLIDRTGDEVMVTVKLDEK